MDILTNLAGMMIAAIIVLLPTLGLCLAIAIRPKSHHQQLSYGHHDGYALMGDNEVYDDHN